MEATVLKKKKDKGKPFSKASPIVLQQQIFEKTHSAG